MEKSERLIPENPIAYNTKVLERLLSAERVQVFIEFQVPAVAIRSVTVEREHAGNASFRTDTVIHAVGFEPHSEAAGLLSSMYREFFLIRYCVKPRRLHNAIAEGFEAEIRIDP